MMKSIFNSIFSKNAKPVFRSPNYQNQEHQNNDNEDIPHFAISENGPLKCDYEVAEISYEEFTRPDIQERRKTPRKSGETRSTYNLAQQ
ncbi:MAG: hypothetical protein Q8K83_05215 [Methylotenera sp.]|nr:hypothetical protein [Methylotenera sp.]